MNEPSKAPFEPIPMPEMPSIPEMPRPSFSRSATPPAPPITRKPLMIADEKPNPFALPQGIAPEAPPVPLANATPVPSAGLGSWLKPSRAKGVVFAGLASLGIGAFGLNALVPMPVRDAPKTGALADSNKTPTMPKVIEEHPAVEPPPLLNRDIVVKVDDPWDKTPEIKLVESTTPTPTPLPTGTALPTAAIVIPGDPLPLPTPLPLEAPAPLPLKVPVTPKVDEKLPAVPGVPTGDLKLPAVSFEPTPETKVVPIDLTPKVETKPPALVVPVELPKVAPLPMSEPKLLALPTAEVKPKLEPLPLPIPVEKSAPLAPVEAKTDYDVDIHKLKAGDTYAIVSQKFYGTAGYAGALRDYNDGAELARMRDVQVPPMHVIKRFGTGRDATDAPRVLPVGVREEPRMVAPPAVERDVQWGTPGSRKTDKPTDGGVNWR